MGFLDYPINLGFWRQDIDVDRVAVELRENIIRKRAKIEQKQEKAVEDKISQLNLIVGKLDNAKKRVKKAKDAETKTMAENEVIRIEDSAMKALQPLQTPKGTINVGGFVSTLFNERNIGDEAARKGISALQRSVQLQDEYLKRKSLVAATEKRKADLTSKLTNAYMKLDKFLPKRILDT